MPKLRIASCRVFKIDPDGKETPVGFTEKHFAPDDKEWCFNPNTGRYTPNGYIVSNAGGWNAGTKYAIEVVHVEEEEKDYA